MIVLDKRHFLIIKSILEKHLLGAEIWFFGSRINGKAKKYSDLDILVKTTNKRLIADALEAFEKSNLPFKVDLLDWDKTSSDFIQLILSDAVTLKQLEENFC